MRVPRTAPDAHRSSWGAGAGAQVVRRARRSWTFTEPGREERRKSPTVPATWRGCVCNIPGTCTSPDLGWPRPQRSGGAAKFLSVQTISQRVVSAVQLCLGAMLAPERAAGTVTGQQANAALTARAWCSLEAGGELLAAKKLLCTAGRWFLRALAAKRLVETSSRPPFVAHFHHANPPFFTFQAPFSLLTHHFLPFRPHFSHYKTS